MRKVFQLQGLACANCAAKIERKASKVEGVSDVRVSFMTQKMTLDASEDRFESALEEIRGIARKIEPDMTIL